MELKNKMVNLSKEETERVYLFDNIKGIMLYLVAFGHILDVYMGKAGVEYNLMKYIYLFHMPMFAFVTGYFSKDYDKARENAVRKILIPYLFFQLSYVLVGAIMIALGLASFNANVFNYSIILPSSAFYYFLAVFFWKLLGKDIMKFRYPLLISLILGLLIGVVGSSEFICGYGAVFALLIFYVGG